MGAVNYLKFIDNSHGTIKVEIIAKVEIIDHQSSKRKPK